MSISELKLAKELIRCPSVTPKDAGAINLLSKNLKSLKLSASSMEEKELLEVKFKKAHSLAVKLNGTVFLLGLGLLWFSALGFEL